MDKLSCRKIRYASFWPRLSCIMFAFACVCCSHHFLCASLWNMAAKYKLYWKTSVLRRSRCRRIQKKSKMQTIFWVRPTNMNRHENGAFIEPWTGNMFASESLLVPAHYSITIRDFSAWFCLLFVTLSTVFL